MKYCTIILGRLQTDRTVLIQGNDTDPQEAAEETAPSMSQVLVGDNNEP